MIRSHIRSILLLGVVLSAAGQAAEKKVLVYTRNFVTNGKGYVHANIPDSIAAIRKLGAENGFAVDASDDPKLFTAESLKQYAVLVFSNSNNEAFENDEQREAFRRYIQAGGGFVGIHSASGSERAWPWFWALLGGKFVRHPKIQQFEVRVKDPSHPATKDLPASFDWSDECYYLDHLNAGNKILLVTDPAKIDDPKKAEYPGDRFGDALPLAWYHEFEGGRAFYTSLGHKKEDYTNPIMTKQILGGILWAMGGKR